jgi:hypothetical protein
MGVRIRRESLTRLFLKSCSFFADVSAVCGSRGGLTPLKLYEGVPWDREEVGYVGDLELGGGEKTGLGRLDIKVCWLLVRRTFSLQVRFRCPAANGKP